MSTSPNEQPLSVTSSCRLSPPHVFRNDGTLHSFHRQPHRPEAVSTHTRTLPSTCSESFAQPAMSEKRKTIRYELPGDETHIECNPVSGNRTGNIEESPYNTNNSPKMTQHTLRYPADSIAASEKGASVELQGTHWCLPAPLDNMSSETPRHLSC
jgi:hypothetical protein